MRAQSNKEVNFTSQLLLAHPALKDPHFRRSVVLMSTHDEAGALGLVINRPLGKQLGELSAELAANPLAGVPLYTGGPVENEKLILAAWWQPSGSDEFKFHLGLEPAQATSLLGQPEVVLRGYLGYSGWGRGQLEDEVRRQGWFVAHPEDCNLSAAEGTALWRIIVGSLGPDFRLLAQEPDELGYN